MFFDLPPEPPKLWLPPKPEIIRPATPDLLAHARQPMSVKRRRGAGGAANVAVVHAVPNDIGENTGLGTGTISFGTQSGLTGSYNGIILLITGRGDGSLRTISNALIDGVGAAEIVTAGFDWHRASIYAMLTSGTTPNVTINWSGNMRACSCLVLAVSGLQSITAVGVQTDVNDATSELDVNTSAGGIVGVCGFSQSGNASTAAFTVDTNILQISSKVISAYGLTTTAEAPRSMGINYASHQNSASACASFR